MYLRYLMQLRGTLSALTGYKRIIFLHFKHKTLNTDILNYFKNENKLKCEIKSPVGGRKSLVISESSRLNRII